MKNVKRVLQAMLLLVCMVFCTACGNQTKQTNPQTGITPSPADTQGNGGSSETEEGLTGKKYDDGVFLMTKSNVKLLGRTWLNNDIRWLSFSASGVEFNFTGKKCEFSLRADSKVNEESHQARYAIYVDNELLVKDVMDIGIKTVSVIDSDTVEEHEIRLVKLSETSDSSMGIQYITCDEEATVSPTSDKELKIEFVGDSITCGYGVDGQVNVDTYSTHNEDATKAYAYRTAQMLNADYSLVSFSGYGIVSGYTGGEKNEKQLVPLYYDKLGNPYGTAGGIKPSELEWDFSYKPDIVVINLGTNDFSYTGSDAAKREEYVQAYYSFLETIREKNPDAIIICALGIMGQDLCPCVQEVVYRFSEDKGDSNIYYVKLDNQAYENGYAVDYHPTAASHEHAAEQMSEAITQILAGTYVPAE
ncbi:MAG: GDSL-type esterase/lipase family protein [Lachnospiraceae bacterium]